MRPLISMLCSTLLCLVGSKVDAGPIAESISFSDQFKIDEMEGAQPDMRHPTFFSIRSPDGSKHGLTADIGTVFKTWLDKRVPPAHVKQDDRSLAIQITSDHDANEKDKIVFSPVQHNGSEHIEISPKSPTYYVSFKFFLDPSYQLPRGWLIHFQAWQCCGGHPPLAISVEPSSDPSGPVVMVFSVRDDEIENARYGGSKEIYKVQIPRSRWMRLSIELNPQPDGSPRKGHVGAWLDCRKLFSYEGPWSFIADRITSLSIQAKQKITSRIGLDLGIYRRRQATTQTIYFDDIKYGTSEEIATSCSSDE